LTGVAEIPYKVAVKPRARAAFTIADLNVRGELELTGEYLYENLERIPGAADLIGHFSGCLWRSPAGFDEPLPDEDQAHLTARWRSCSASAGLFSFRCRGALLSISLLAAGTEPEAEGLAFDVLQRHLLHELHDTGYEPAFALMDLRERPVAATINFGAPAGGLAPADRMSAALADRCFAASYFRFLGLA
jgi:hypothetical protein